VYDRVAHLEIAHDDWLKLCNTSEDSSEIKSSRRDTYNRQYQIALLALSRLLAAYVLVVLLHILIMNVLNNCCMLLMTLCGVWK
jgi:hypothetical protein